MKVDSLMSDALADLAEAVSGGRDINEAIAEIAKTHGVKTESLAARAYRKGGIAEMSGSLIDRANIISNLNIFEKEGLLFGCPFPDFSAWRRERGGKTLSEMNAAFVRSELQSRRVRAQERSLQQMLLVVAQGKIDD